MTDAAPPFTLLESTVAPWLSVADGPRAVRFYTSAFGATELYRLESRSGGVVVAQLRVGRTEFWLQENRDARADPCREQMHMTLTVDDPGPFMRRAVAAGATEIAPVSERHGWHSGRLADPFGHHWEIGEPPARRDA